MNYNSRLFEKIQLYLMEPEENLPVHVKFSDTETEIRDRIKNVFTYWLGKPTLSDRQVVNYMRSNFGVSESQSYRYLGMVKVLLGNVRNATKEWQRFKLIAMIDKAYAVAEMKKDAKSMILAADKLGKYTMLDKEDAQKIPWDEIVPMDIEPTGDVSVLGIKPIPNLLEKQKKMREKYGASPIEDAKYELLEDGQQEA